MLMWERPIDLNETEDEQPQLVQARVTTHAADGTPLTLFIVNARPHSWDVQTSLHYVLARGEATSLEQAQRNAQTVMSAILQRLQAEV